MSTIDHLSELESLRSQVADLSRKIAERDWLDLLRAIVEGTAADTGEELFQSLVTHLARTLNVRYALVGELTGPGAERIRSLAFCSDGRLLESVEYEILETPFRLVVDQTLLVFEQSLREQFPNARRLADLGAESFCGMTLRDKSGKVLGVLAIMDDKPLQDRADLRSLMTIFAARASAELERNGLVDALDRSQQFLYSIVEHIPLAVFAKDAKHNFNIVLWNKKAEDIFGITRAQMLGRNAHDYWPQKEADFFLACDQQTMAEGKLIDVPEEPSTHPVKGCRTLCTKKVPLLDHEKNPRYLLTLCEDITERKRVEEAVREREDRFNYVIEATNDGIWEWNVQTGVVYFSPQWIRLLGYSPAEVSPSVEFFLTILHPEDRARMTQVIQEHLEGRTQVKELEIRLRQKSGEYRWYLDRGKVVSRDKDGSPARMVGTITDITKRKAMEAELKLSESRLREAQRIALVGSWELDVITNQLWWSDEAFRIFEIDPKRFGASYQAFLEIVHPEDRQFVDRSYIESLANRTPYDLEHRVLLPDGLVKHIHERCETLYDIEGKPLRSLGTVQDITERKVAEEALRESEERFDLAVRGSNTGIWDWDLRTNKTYFSPLWKSMLGYEAHELRGEFSEWEARLHPDDRERALATVQAYLKGGLPQYELEHRLRHKDGGYRWILARGVSISDAEGKPYRMAGSHIDITEQKQTQETLSRSEHQLRTVLDMLPVGVWFTDLSGKPILANPAARQIWSGVKQVGIETAANGTGWWEAIGPSGELHRWALSHVLTKGVPSLNETLDLECIDGTKKTIRNTTVPVQDEAGVLLGAIVLNEDVTVLRQVQEALKLTQFSVDHAVEGFFWIGFDARILNVNDAACRMLEYTRDELTTMMIHDINPSFPPETWLAHWEELKQKGSLTFESKHWSRTGRVLDTEVTVNYLQYEGREYSCAIMRDIGERKRAEEVLQNSEERFTKAFRVSSHLIGITEFDTGCCVDVNDACLEMFGYRREEVIGQSTITLGLWPRSEDRDRLLRTIKDDGMIRNLERSITTKNGEVRQVVISSDPVQINGIPCLLTVGHDVTERKRMEEALRQRERDLRAAIEERERISQDLHDGILQSLFAVGLSLETTKSRMSPKERKSSGPALMQAIDQLNRLMQEVRNFIAGLGSDLLQGKDLPTALHQMLESLTKHHPTRVRLKIEDRAARALSTEQSLHLLLVIQEAVTNCIRHGRAQEATVSLKLLKQVIRLSVRDNGCGFNPNAAKGTGHGLVNMAARARKIGGRLTLSSHVNEGTRVVLDLPKEASLVHR